ncbi:MAG: hypothetical protein AABY01_02495 [Nanoarchaeota archaeon]
MMGGCTKCQKICGILMLLAGICFLLQNLNIWNFWNLSWWTVLFLLWGIGGIASANCKDCQKK